KKNGSSEKGAKFTDVYQKFFQGIITLTSPLRNQPRRDGAVFIIFPNIYKLTLFVDVDNDDNYSYRNDHATCLLLPCSHIQTYFVHVFYFFRENNHLHNTQSPPPYYHIKVGRPQYNI